MKNVLNTTLLALTIALPAMAQPVTPGETTNGNMQQLPVQAGDGPSTAEGQKVMPDGSTVSDPSTPGAAAGGVQVRMPDGKLVDIPDSADTPWYRNEQMQGYTSYYFDPANRVYVVRGENAPDNWPKKNWGVE